MRFPHQYPPPRPRLSLFCASTAALASRSRWTMESWPSRAAKSSGVLPREPRPEAKPRAEPNGTKSRKNLRKFWVPQRSKFWKLWPLNFLHGLNEHCGFAMSWSHRVGWKSHVNHGGSPNDLVPSSTFNLHGPASFSEKQYISACSMLTNYHKNPKNSTFKSKHGTTKWNETTPGHWMPLHHVIASPNLQGDQATTSLSPVPSSSVFCTEFTSLRIKCLMAPTLFSLAASRMSRPRIPFKSKISCWGSDA